MATIPTLGERAGPAARTGGAAGLPPRPSWLLPDLALTAACVTLFYCLFLFQGYQKLFRDSDAGWHIRAGEAMLRSGALPRTDPYSFTQQGRPWVAWEWGSDMLVAAAHRGAGLSGVALLYAAAISGGVWLWFRLHWAAGGNFLLAGAMSPLLLSTCNLHWLARPHVFGWLFLVGALLYAERARPPFRPRDALAVAAATAVWANLHPSFFWAPAIAVVYGAGSLVRPLLWRLDAAQERARARWFGWAALVSALAGLANPYGWNLYGHLFEYLTDSALLARIGEFQSFDFHAPGSEQILLAVGVAAAGGVLAAGRRRPEWLALAVLVLAVALRSARGLPLVALMLLPLANASITEALRDAAGWQAGPRAAVDWFLAYSARLRALDARMGGLALAPVALLVCFWLLRTPGIAAATGFPADQFPVRAALEVAKLPPEARLFAPDKFGGYLIYRFAGTRQVFFDGRSDLYGAQFLERYGRMAQVRPGWRATWDSFRFTHALLPNDYSLIPALEQAGWKEMYRDGTATLLAPGRN